MRATLVGARLDKDGEWKVTIGVPVEDSGFIAELAQASQSVLQTEMRWEGEGSVSFKAALDTMKFEAQKEAEWRIVLDVSKAQGVGVAKLSALTGIVLDATFEAQAREPVAVA